MRKKVKKTQKTAEQTLLHALAEKLKGWAVRDLEFLGVESGDDIWVDEWSDDSILCAFSTNACRYSIYIDSGDDGVSMNACAVIGGCAIEELPDDYDGVFRRDIFGANPFGEFCDIDRGGPFCENTWRDMLLSILTAEADVAALRVQAMRHQLEELAAA